MPYCFVAFVLLCCFLFVLIPMFVLLFWFADVMFSFIVLFSSRVYTNFGVDRRKVYVIAFIVFAIHNPHIRYFRRCFSCTVTALRSLLMAAKKLNIQTPTSRGDECLLD